MVTTQPQQQQQQQQQQQHDDTNEAKDEAEENIIGNDPFANIDLCDIEGVGVGEGKGRGEGDEDLGLLTLLDIGRLIYIFVPKGSNEEKLISEYIDKAKLALYEKATKIAAKAKEKEEEKENRSEEGGGEDRDRDRDRDRDKKKKEEDKNIRRFLRLMKRLDDSLIVFAPYEADLNRCPRSSNSSNNRNNKKKDNEEDREEDREEKEACSCRVLRDKILNTIADNITDDDYDDGRAVIKGGVGAYQALRRPDSSFIVMLKKPRLDQLLLTETAADTEAKANSSSSSSSSSSNSSTSNNNSSNNNNNDGYDNDKLNVLEVKKIINIKDRIPPIAATSTTATPKVMIDRLGKLLLDAVK